MGLTFFMVSVRDQLGNIEPELSFVFHLRRITFCGVRLSVETVAHPEVILFPLLLSLVPMPITPACYAEVQNIIFPFAIRDHFLILRCRSMPEKR
jgi:hypothetical protein